jgi:hypothetical protein
MGPSPARLTFRVLSRRLRRSFGEDGKGRGVAPGTYGTIFVTVLLLFASFDSGTMLPSSALILKA